MRDRFATWMFTLTQRPYAALKNRTPWGLSPLQLAAMEPGTLGHALGRYLMDNGYELMDNLEPHDVCHLLTGVGTDVESELELQFVLYGNGKRSVYLLGVVLLGLVLWPDRWERWKAAARRGARWAPFFDLDFHAHLESPLAAVAVRPRDVQEGSRRKVV